MDIFKEVIKTFALDYCEEKQVEVNDLCMKLGAVLESENPHGIVGIIALAHTLAYFSYELGMNHDTFIKTCEINWKSVELFNKEFRDDK